MKRGSVLSLIQPKMWKRCILHFEKSGRGKQEVSLNWEGSSLCASPIQVQVPSPKCPYLASPDLDMGNKMAPKNPKASATQTEACQSCGVSALPQQGIFGSREQTWLNSLSPCSNTTSFLVNSHSTSPVSEPHVGLSLLHMALFWKRYASREEVLISTKIAVIHFVSSKCFILYTRVEYIVFQKLH